MMATLVFNELMLNYFVICFKIDANCNLRFVNSEIVSKKVTFQEAKSTTYMET